MGRELKYTIKREIVNGQEVEVKVYTGTRGKRPSSTPYVKSGLKNMYTNRYGSRPKE